MATSFLPVSAWSPSLVRPIIAENSTMLRQSYRCEMEPERTTESCFSSDSSIFLHRSTRPSCVRSQLCHQRSKQKHRVRQNKNHQETLPDIYPAPVFDKDNTPLPPPSFLINIVAGNASASFCNSFSPFANGKAHHATGGRRRLHAKD